MHFLSSWTTRLNPHDLTKDHEGLFFADIASCPKAQERGSNDYNEGIDCNAGIFNISLWAPRASLSVAGKKKVEVTPPGTRYHR